MKKVMMLAGIFSVLLFGINVYAANGINLTLSCPSEVEPNSSFTCGLYATVTGNNVDSFNITSIKGEDGVVYISHQIDSSIDKTSNKKIGTINAKSKNISGGGRIIIKYKAVFEGGSAKYSDIAKYIDIVSSVNTLNSIKVDGKIVPHFSKTTTNYALTTTKSKVDITATKTSSKSTLVGTGTKSLKCGNNVNVLSVRAENGKVKKYNVNVNRKCSNNAYLKGITVSEGTLSPSFKEDVYDYTVSVDKNTEAITVTGIKDDATQKITGEVTNKELKYGKNKVSLTVTSQTGGTKTYNIVINKKDDRSSSTKLESLTLSEGDIEFNKDIYEYETKVLYDVQNIVVTALPEDEKSKVEITGNENLKVGENTITISVKSEKGSKSEYKIKVTKLEEGATFGDNANIKSITIKGYKFPFDYNKYEYKLVINREDSLDINVVMDDESATYEIKGNENLKDGSVIEIITKSNDGSSKTYTITVTKSSYAIYYIISGVLVVLAILIPTLVYFKSVKKKKELLDVNGYKVGKEYEEKDYSRKVISNTSDNTLNEASVNTNQINQNVGTDNTIDNNMSNDMNNNINLGNINNMNELNTVYNAFDSLQNSNVNNSNITQEQVMTNNINQSVNSCPNCGRELLGTPDICPYCSAKLR